MKELLETFKEEFEKELGRDGTRYPVEIEEIMTLFENAGTRAVVQYYQEKNYPTPVPPVINVGLFLNDESQSSKR